jgi:DNA-binding transcriptional regulator YiaG
MLTIMDDELFNQLKTSLEQAVEFTETGKGKVRFTHFDFDGMDIKAVRRKTKMTQPAFSQAFKINTETLRAWEQGKNTPPSYAIAYLKTIAVNPELVVGAIGIQVT